MRFLFLALALTCAAACRGAVVFARDFAISSAQDDANEIARTGVLRHLGRNGGRREGIGMASTPDAALRRCCYYGQYRIADQGVAYSPARRMWFAVIRYH